ncbi:cation diffusion facilitator family transporter [Corynebacterium stationis]|uniref:cation diffusion facilitator family transporter n=1 Tax=Corynebacterium stationis TaxID=1705 RepID=UPI0028AD5022|nr:cation diffusion facilitator family transporter [Corynebacterium stationis]
MKLGTAKLKRPRHDRLPEQQQETMRKAVRMERVTIGFVIVTIVLVGAVAGQSQAMRSAWVEDMLSLVPPLAFLIASRVVRIASNRRQPYGYHRAIAIGHQAAALALLVMGGLLVFESISALIKQEKPPIGVVVLFGQDIWMGWLMIVVMAISAIPMVILGRIKLRLAKELHDKLLYADADMAKADWGTAAATIIGVLGIGLGFWWADSIAALVISVSIVKDGITNIRAAVTGLSDAQATRYDDAAAHPLTTEVEKRARETAWVLQTRARVREQGHIFHTELFVVPVEGYVPTPAETADLHKRIEKLDWKLQDTVIAVVEELDPEQVPPSSEARVGASSKSGT